MDEQMKIILSATDNASSTFEAVQNAAEDLEQSLDNVGAEGSNDMNKLEAGADQAEDDVRELGDEAKKTGDEVENLGDKSESSGATMQMAFQNIADGVERAKEGVLELGHNLMETLSLAGQQEQQETFLKMNIGAEGAAKQMKIINDLVADLPGDDVAIGGLLSQAAAKNASITANELERMGNNAADYFAAMSNYGKSSAEAQQDLTNYILTGNTAELERSPILQAHIDKLKQATTVEERNKALQEAMNAEGWAGISQQDTYNNKLETFTAMLDRGKRSIGGLFLGVASGAMDFISQLDNATGGVLGMGIAIGSVAGGPMIDLLTGAGQMATGLKALQEAYKGLALSEKLVNLVEGEGVIARIASALGITTEAAAADGAAVSFWGLSIAEDAALWPILLIAAAIAGLIVVVYELGKSFGWWTDVGSMIDAVWAGIQRLWSAFINHPDVQVLIEGLTQAWDMLSSAVMGVLTLIGSFLNVNTGGDFDIVRALIEAIGLAWEALTFPIRLVITLIQSFISAGQAVVNGQINILEAVRNVWNTLTAFFSQILFQIVTLIVNWSTQIFNNAVMGALRFVNGIMSSINSLPGKFLKILILVLNYIITRVNQWVSNAKRGALNLVNGVMNYLKTLPSKALSALVRVVTSIVTAGARWVSNVKTQAQKVVDGAYNTLTSLPDKVASAVSGVVDAITKPFKDAYDQAKKIWDDITTLGGLLPGGGSAGFDIEGMLEEMTNRQGFTVQSENSLDVNVKHELDLNFNLDNVPAGADEETIIRMIQESMNNTSVVKALVNNPDFQSLDQKIKDRIVLKNNRARGV